MFRLLEKPQGTSFLTVRDRDILETFYTTGIRISELVSISVGDIRPDQKTVKVLGKGKKERLLPLGTRALGAMDDYFQKRRQFLAGNRLELRSQLLDVDRLGVDNLAASRPSFASSPTSCGSSVL